jgi:hypothetical protein
VTVAVIESKNCTRGDAALSEVYNMAEMSRHLSIFDNSVQPQASMRAFINSNSESSAHARRNIPASPFTRGP